MANFGILVIIPCSVYLEPLRSDRLILTGGDVSLPSSLMEMPDLEQPCSIFPSGLNIRRYIRRYPVSQTFLTERN